VLAAGRAREAGGASGRPRLLATAGDFDRLRGRIAEAPASSWLNHYYASLKEEADAILREPPSRYGIPDPVGGNHNLLRTARQVLRRVMTLALIFRLIPDERYARRAWQEMHAAARFPDWYPDHFLSTAEMTFALAVGYDWLHGHLGRERRTLLREAIHRKGLRPALRCYRGLEPHRGRWVTADTNWNLVCNGGVGAGALAVLGEDVDGDAREVLEGALSSIEHALGRFAPDGGWPEGYTYWGYGTFYATVFIEALRTSGLPHPDLAGSPGFSETGLFPLYLTGPGMRVFNYGDTDGDLWNPSPQLYLHSRRFGHPEYVWLHHRQLEEGTASPHPLDLLWYDARQLSPSRAGLPTSRLFRGLGVVTMRGSWEDANSTFLGFKAGSNRENHAHLDQGSFVLDALGERWAIDLRGEPYTSPGYNWREGRRWEYYRARAEGHNTLVIDPGSGPDQDPEASAGIVRFGRAPYRTFVIADLTPLYFGRVEDLRRGIAMLDRNCVLIQDELSAQSPVDAFWFMHFRANVLVSKDGRKATLSRGDRRLLAVILAPSAPDVRFSVMDAAPLKSSPNPPQASNNGVRKLAIRLHRKRRSRLAVLLLPLKEGEAPDDRPVSVIPLSQW
jgi:hypothetical protein